MGPSRITRHSIDACKRCGTRHDDLGLWECTKCGATLCEKQISYFHPAPPVEHDDAFVVHWVYEHRAVNVSTYVQKRKGMYACGPCDPVEIVKGQRICVAGVKTQAVLEELQAYNLEGATPDSVALP